MNYLSRKGLDYFYNKLKEDSSLSSMVQREIIFESSEGTLSSIDLKDVSRYETLEISYSENSSQIETRTVVLGYDKTFNLSIMSADSQGSLYFFTTRYVINENLLELSSTRYSSMYIDTEKKINTMEHTNNIRIFKIVGTLNKKSLLMSIVDFMYPIGYIYMSFDSSNPGDLFGGTWEQIEDTFLLACGSKYKAGSIGGEAEHTLTVDEIPSHKHYVNRASYPEGIPDFWSPKVFGYNEVEVNKSCYGQWTDGDNCGGGSHNNMPPYTTVYVWKRVS